MASYKSCFKTFQSEPLPEIIYTDTSFFVEALVYGQRYHKETIDFIGKLAKAQPVIVFSEILKSELRCSILSICIRNQFGGDKIKVTDKIKESPELIHKYFSEIQKQENNFMGILQRFKDWTSIPLDEKISKKSLEVMQKYRLASYDAVHIATMESWNIKDIVTLDGGLSDLPQYRANSFIWSVNGWVKYKTRHKIK